MTKPSKPIFIVIFVFLIAAIACFLWFLYPAGKFGDESKKDDIAGQDQQKFIKMDSRSQQKPDVSIQDLSTFYDSNVGRIPDWECEHKRVLIELILIEQETNETYSPKKGITVIDTKKDSDKIADQKLESTQCPYRYGKGNGDGPFIYYMNIAKNCRNCTVNALIPGETYKLVRIGDHKELNYTFQVPAAEELVFKHEFDHDELTGAKDDPVHRIPVVVEEAVKTKEEPETSIDPTAPVPEKTLTVKGVPELAEDERLLVHYMHEGGKQRDAKRMSEGTWKITLRQRGLETAAGGSLVLYRITPSQRKRSGIAAKLIGYVPEVRQDPVKLGEVKYRNYDEKTWHRDRIQLNPLLSEQRVKELKKQDPAKVEEQKGVFLDVKRSTTAEPVHVSLSQVEEENNAFYVTLTAPPGTYTLKFEEQVIDSDFDWPRK